MNQRKRCQLCHELKTDVKERIDPYFHDVENTDVKVTMCDSCTHERAMDI